MNDDIANDEELAKKTQQGEIKCFGLLVERYQKKIKRYAKRFLFNYEDAEDLTQEIFLKTYENIQSFDAKRKFSTWLYRIAHNHFINAIKKKGKEPLPLFDFDVFLPRLNKKETLEKEIIAKETNGKLDTLLSRLDPKYREPLILYFYENLSYKEIADILRIPQSTVGVRLKRAKQNMRADLLKT